MYCTPKVPFDLNPPLYTLSLHPPPHSTHPLPSTLSPSLYTPPLPLLLHPPLPLHPPPPSTHLPSLSFYTLPSLSFYTLPSLSFYTLPSLYTLPLPLYPPPRPPPHTHPSQMMGTKPGSLQELFSMRIPYVSGLHTPPHMLGHTHLP